METIKLQDYEYLEAYSHDGYYTLINEIKKLSEGDKIQVLVDGDKTICYLVPQKVVQNLVTQYVAKELMTVEVDSSDLGDK